MWQQKMRNANGREAGVGIRSVIVAVHAVVFNFLCCTNLPSQALKLVAQNLNAVGLIVPILIIASIILLPIIFHVIAGFEQYKTQSGHEIMTLIRSSIFSISTLIVYLVAAYTKISRLLNSLCEPVLGDLHWPTVLQPSDTGVPLCNNLMIVYESGRYCLHKAFHKRVQHKLLLYWFQYSLVLTPKEALFRASSTTAVSAVTFLIVLGGSVFQVGELVDASGTGGKEFLHYVASSGFIVPLIMVLIQEEDTLPHNRTPRCSAIVIVLLTALFARSNRKYDISGKHVLVTGGSSGIGKAVAKEALKRGAGRVTLLARDKRTLEEAAAELRGVVSGTQTVLTLSADVSKAAVKDAVSELCSSVPVDILVNSAGVCANSLFEDTDPKKLEEIVTTNVLGCMYATQAVIPFMKKKGEGAIVFIASDFAQMGFYEYAAYCASKFALRGLAESLHMELRPHGIGVFISFPPDTDTPMLTKETSSASLIGADLSAFLNYSGSVFKPEMIAVQIWNGVASGRHQIHHGFSGFILTTLCSGMSPVWCVWDCIVQVCLMGLFRIIGVVCLKTFEGIISGGLKKYK
eukprot:Em0017g422a